MTKVFIIIPVVLAVVFSIFIIFDRPNPTKEDSTTVSTPEVVSFLNNPDANVDDYTMLEPPLHPKFQEMLDNINKSNINPEKLDWIALSEYFKDSGINEEFAFDLDFPQDYLVVSTTPSKEGTCVLFRGKEETMFEFCDLANLEYIENLELEFNETPSQTDFKGMQALKRKRTNIGIFPKEELLIIKKSNSGQTNNAYHIKYSLKDLDSFTPQDTQVWEQYREGYEKVDVPVSVRMLDSLIFN